MKPYEAAMVFVPDIVEERFDAILKRVSAIITERGGVATEPQKWGKRRLAYEVKHHRDGVYVFLPFESDENTPAEIERVLRISEDVLRFMVVSQMEQAPVAPATAADDAKVEAGTEGESAPVPEEVTESGGMTLA